MVPWFERAHLLPAEDAVALNGYRTETKGAIKIVVPRLPRISNFDDLDPLRAEPDVRVELVEPGHALPADADLILLPGSKSTIGDLQALRDAGWDIDIKAHARRGGRVLGLCGGYQMLGTRLDDPDGTEGPAGAVDGLGLLQVETRLGGDKALLEVTGERSRERPSRARLRDAYRQDRRRGLRAADAGSRGPARWRDVGGRAHHGQLCARHLRRR